jgi:TP901 family phage tail tape measure protein
MPTGTTELKILLTADNKASGALKGVKDNLLGIGKVATGAIVGGFAIAGTAAAAFGIKAATSFISFEDSMNEVATLLPGLSQEAFGAMQDDVLALSKDTGRLTEEVIPALYQSLSAGVPPDNVFEFMELAHKAALGGVTELETAVDGITSVVNAYGEEMIDSTQASDLMFTAVRLGKTTFGELSQSLSNVTPLAAGLGVKFDDVTAGLAAMTAQGTPTAVATTQLRALFQELGTAGTEVADTFEELSGKTFIDFIAEGNNTADALQLMEQHALETGVPIQDMFGNVRAGLGALQLTGAGMETFVGNLEEMAGSAGATEAAYETMNGGLARTFEEIKARFEALFIEAGRAMAPFIRQMADIFMPLLENLFAFVDEKIVPIIERFGFAFDGLVENLKGGMSPLEAIKNLISNVLITIFGQSVDQALAFQDAFDGVVATIRDFIDRAREVLEPIIDWITQFVSLKDVAIVLFGVMAAAIAAVLIPIGLAIAKIGLIIAGAVAVVALLRNAWENNWLGIRDIVTAVVNFIKNFIDAALEAIKAFWEEHGEAIIAAAQQAWEFIKTAIDAAVTFIRNVVETVLTAIKAFWEEHGEAIMQAAEAAWQFIQDHIQFVIEYIQTIVSAFQSAFEGDWRAFGEKLREAWELVWNRIKEILETIIPIIVRFISQLVLDIIAKFQEVDWGQLGRDVIQGILNGLRAAGGAIVSFIVGLAQNALDAIRGFFGIESPSKVMAEVGENMIAGLVQGLGSGISDIDRAMSRVNSSLMTDGLFTANINGGGPFFSDRNGAAPEQHTHFHLSTNTVQSGDTVLDDFNLMQALAV